MTGKDLIAEGQRIARPSIHLRPDGESDHLAAIWRGPGQVPCLTPEHTHWLTIDCRFLPPGVGLKTGCLSVYTDDDKCQGGVALHDPLATLVVSGKGQRLYAHAVPSLPPLEAVFLYGSPTVREWLGQVGWQADWGMNGNFPAKEISSVYEKAWFENMPLYGDQAVAVLGGWHVPWPDGDWLELVDHPLVVFTLAESEPWVEVFDMGESFQVIQRVS